MIVLKFGGTSVGTVESLMNVKRIVESLQDRAIVIVSALGGLTDRLIATAEMAAAGNAEFQNEMDAIVARHRNIIENVVDEPKREACMERVMTLLGELRRLYEGVSLIADLPHRTLDAIVAYGEKCSSVIVAAMIKDASLHYSPDYIKTERRFRKNITDAALTNELICREFTEDTQYPAVAGGFISSDRDNGEITNLGRGGSDYTAALIAAALNADELQIWTDVDGFMTSDPRIIPDAHIIPQMSFVESMELCSFGAKVVYPPTIYPVFHKNIPIKILNTFNPTAPGTLITDTRMEGSALLRGLSSLKATTLIRIAGEAAQNIPMISSRTFNALARKGVSVTLVAGDNADGTFALAISSGDAEIALNVLNAEFSPEIIKGTIASVEATPGMAVIAVVGEQMQRIRQLGTRIISALAAHGIEVEASNDASSKTTATFVVREDLSADALRVIHTLFFSEAPVQIDAPKADAAHSDPRDSE